MDSFEELLAVDVINHSAPPGRPNGRESFYFFLNEVLCRGIPDVEVEILGTHTGELLGFAPTHRHVEINVIDIIRLKDGKYQEPWGRTDLFEVLRHQ